MEYRPTRVADVIRDINRDYYLPAIQREFVWQPDDIAKLFDSIMGDFPIGSFLFWKLREEHKNDWVVYEFIREFDRDNPHNPEADMRGVNRDIRLVLDGQQRMTSLYIGLKGSYRYFYYRWRKEKLYLNLLKPPTPNEDDPESLTYQFAFRESPEPNTDGQEFWYAVGRILDFADAEDAKSDVAPQIAHLPEEQRANAMKLVGRLHARVHTVLVINYYEEPSQDYDKVLQIFVRANSAGEPLEYSDLLLSTATAKWERLDAREEIHQCTDNLNGIGGGYGFGKDFVLKGSLYLTPDLPIQYMVKNFTRRNLLAIEANWENVKTYLGTTVRLISKYGFTRKNIVAPLALLPIGFFLMRRGNENFDRSSEASDVANQVALRRWLVFVILKNAFGRATDRALKNVRDVLVAQPPNVDFQVASLNAALGIEPHFTDTELDEILSYQYQGRYTYLVLSLLYPDRDWKDAVFHEDHIFPRAEFQTGKLRRRGYGDERIAAYQALCNRLPNLQLLTDTENLSKNSTPFDEWIGTRDAGFKARHHIAGGVGCSMDAFEEFIGARRKKLLPITTAPLRLKRSGDLSR